MMVLLMIDLVASVLVLALVLGKTKSA
jgi:hypothetical protein